MQSELPPQRPCHEGHVVCHHPDKGIARRCRQLVIRELIDEIDACFTGDLLHYLAWENFGAENGRHIFLLYLLDDANDFPGSRLGKIGGLYGGNHFHAITRCEVGKGIMIGHELAVVFRNGADAIRNGLVQFAQLAQINGRIRDVSLLVRGIERDQSVPDYFRIAHCQRDVGPQMRIG